MSQTEEQISIVKLDEVVENALKYYVEYMGTVLRSPGLSKADPRVHANAKRSENAARRFLGNCEEGNSISVADGEEDIKQYIIMLVLYRDYLGSINDAMEPSLREQKIADQAIKDERKKTVKKMYDFYSLLTQIKHDRI